MRAPGSAGLCALPDPAEPEPGACREPGSRPRGIGGRPADRSSSFGRRFHGQGPWSAAGASGIRCEDATVGVVIPRFRCAKSPASMPDALTGGQRACSTYGDRVRPEPNPVMRIVSIAVLGTVTGALASLAAILFVKLVVVLNDWLLISARSRIMADDAHWVMLATLCVPAVGGLVVGLMLRHIPERRPHGPPDVIRVVQGLEDRIAPRSGLLSALASLVSLGAGASVGQYGPLVHLGATLGSLISRIGRHGRWMATVGVGCGVASAISTAFTAPRRRHHLRARSDPAALLPARVRTDHCRLDGGLRHRHRRLRSPSPVPGGRRERGLRARVPGVHPDRGRRRPGRGRLHARHPSRGPGSQES